MLLLKGVNLICVQPQDGHLRQLGAAAAHHAQRGGVRCHPVATSVYNRVIYGTML